MEKMTNRITKFLCFFIAIAFIIGCAFLTYPKSNIAEAITIRPSATNSAKIPEIIVDEEAAQDPYGPHRVLDKEEDIVKKFTTVNLYSYFDAAKEDFALPTVKKQMEESWTSIQDKNVSELNGGLTDELAKEIGGNDAYTKDNFEITYFFDLTIDEDSLEKLYEEPKNHIDIAFKLLEVEPTDNPPVVLYRCEDSTEWKMIPLSDVKNNGDYTITVRFYELCSILIVNTKDIVLPPINPSSFETIFPWWTVIVGATVATMIFLLVMLFKKKQEEEEESAEGTNAPNNTFMDDDDD